MPRAAASPFIVRLALVALALALALVSVVALPLVSASDSVVVLSPSLEAEAEPDNRAPWDPEFMMKMLMYSAAAYSNPSKLSKWSCHYCCNATAGFKVYTFMVNNATDTFGYVGVNTRDEEIVVVFRGTQPSHLANWITDLNFAKLTYYGGLAGANVHEGFYRAYNTVQSDLLESVAALTTKYPKYNLVITGHSLGAALATLATVDLMEHNFLVSSLYTFGSPRVGNAIFAEYYWNMGIPTYRMVNMKDLVPHLPPETVPLVGGFHHVPREVWYNLDNEFQICDKSGEDPTCSDSLGIHADSIPDHITYFGIHV